MDLQPVKGTRDFFPEQMRQRNWLFDVWRKVSLQSGFEEYDTCVLEHEELYIRKAGDEISQQLYSFEDKSGRRLSLRPEMTPSLARMILQHQRSLPMPVRWFSIPQCFRYERMTKGRRREHFQWNADIIGQSGVTAEAEILLLAFTPTILDPEMPELKRANLPIGWAYPAFDRLQLEDYDWLTGGATAARRAGYDLVQARLGYPLEVQDYLSGFVLLAQDADLYWRRIDAGLDEARRRGVPRRYVWALPQIARDGYTRLPNPDDTHEDAMTPFDDIAYPLALGRDASVSPEFSTAVALTASGHERRNALWSDARLRFDVGPGIRSEDELGTLIAFFRARHGPARGFRLRDPFDFSSNGMTGVPTAFDQIIGTGDGLANAALGHPRVWLEIDPDDGFVDCGYCDFAAGEAPSIPLIELREEIFA